MKKWLIRLSVVVNVLIAALLVGLWLGGGKLLSKYFLEASHARWVSQFEVLPVQPGDVVFLGDSITEGGIWEELFPNLPVRNRGIGGDVTAGVIKRLHQVVDGQPAKVFLLIGTNDLAGGIEPSEIAANVTSIIERINANSPDTEVYVQSVLPRAASYREQVEALNALLKKSIPAGAHWIDLYPLFLDSADGSIRNDLSNDELHLVGEGYLIWRNAIAEQVGG